MKKLAFLGGRGGSSGQRKGISRDIMITRQVACTYTHAMMNTPLRTFGGSGTIILVIGHSCMRSRHTRAHARNEGNKGLADSILCTSSHACVCASSSVCLCVCLSLPRACFALRVAQQLNAALTQQRGFRRPQCCTKGRCTALLLCRPLVACSAAGSFLAPQHDETKI